MAPLPAAGFHKAWGLKVLGFRFRFRVLGFRGLGFKVQGLQVSVGFAGGLRTSELIRPTHTDTLRPLEEMQLNPD